MPITVAPADVQDARLGVAYSRQLSASGGTAPYTFAVTSGSLPPGITLSSAGLLSGTPTVVGAYTFTVTGTDSAGSPATDTEDYTINVVAANEVNNSLIDRAASLVPAPYGPLTRVTDFTNLPKPNISHTIELTTAVGGYKVKATYLQLIDAQAIQRQIAFAVGLDYKMNELYDKITAVKAAIDLIHEADGVGYTYTEYFNTVEDLREFFETSGYL